MSSISDILTSIKEATGVASSDASGTVIESQGDIDADTVCAVAAMSMGTLDEAGDLLGLGALEGWSIVTKSHALYVHRRGVGFIAVSGPTTKSPEAVLKKLGV